MTQAAAATASADIAKPAEPKKIDVGTVAALGVAFGSIATFLGLMVGHLIGIIAYGPLAIIGLILGVIALISGPSIILAYIKLRKRNLGPILDANGWAVNAKAKINIPFGRSLTHQRVLPPGSQRDLRDPYKEKKGWRNFGFILVLLVVALGVVWHYGIVEKVMPGVFTKPEWLERRAARRRGGSSTLRAAPPMTDCPAARCR